MDPLSRPAPSLVPTQTFRIAAGARTDIGTVRSENQDTYGVLPTVAVGAGVTPGRIVPQPAVFAVADGMGGHEAGAEASHTAMSTLLDAFGPAFRTQTDRLALLRHAVEAANAAVWARATSGPHVRQMGTTCTLLLVADGHAYVGHVGDSRAYRIRGDRVEQLTTDHTLGEETRNNPSLAEITRARSHHLTRAVGIRERVEVDAVAVGALQVGDRFLLCSDGLAPVGLEEVVRTVQRYSPQEAADWLVLQASALGSRDNATAVVVQVAP